MSKLVNLLAHTINDVSSGKAYEPSGQVARVNKKDVLVKDINGTPLYITEYGEIHGLPDEVEGTFYIVSAIIINAIHVNGLDRKDCVAPRKTQRDSMGNPVACNGLRFNG